MRKQKLGNLEVGAVGLGCMGMTHGYSGPSDEQEMTDLIHQAVDMGYTLFDTAESYVDTDRNGVIVWNEELVGKALKPFRDQVMISTKFGVYQREGKLVTDSRPQTIRKAVEGSLMRLGTDHIDLYFQHRIDPGVPEEEVADTIRQLMKEGKVLHWGISQADEQTIRRAHAVCPLTAIQNRYSMLARKDEKLFPVLEELQIGYVAFSPLANGLLSGAYGKNTSFTDPRDIRSRMPQFDEKNRSAEEELLSLLKTIASEKGTTPAAISLAWMIDKKPYIVPIPGTRKAARLRENASAADVRLTNDEIHRMDELLSKMNLVEAVPTGITARNSILDEKQK